MLKALKNMPIWLKIVIGCIVLVVIAKSVQRPHPRPYYTGPVSASERDADWDVAGGRAANPDGGNADRREMGNTDPRGAGDRGADQRQQMLAYYQSQQSELMARVHQCMAQMQQATNQMAIGAMNGQMPGAGAPCQQNMPQWTAQEAFLETEIYRIQSGDTTSSLRQITGIAPPTYSSPSYPSSRSSRPSSSDDETDAVDAWDRGAIRGNSLYTDETGTQRELATHSYYFRDRASGELIGSEQPYPPNNGRDYEVIQPQPQQ